MQREELEMVGRDLGLKALELCAEFGPDETDRVLLSIWLAFMRGHHSPDEIAEKLRNAATVIERMKQRQRPH